MFTNYGFIYWRKKTRHVEWINSLNQPYLTAWSRSTSADLIAITHYALCEKVIQDKKLNHRHLENVKSGKGKSIPKALGGQLTIVRNIIQKQRKQGPVVHLPRSGQPTKITPRSASTTYNSKVRMWPWKKWHS